MLNGLDKKLLFDDNEGSTSHAIDFVNINLKMILKIKVVTLSSEL